MAATTDLPLALAHDGHGVPDEAEQETAGRGAGGRRGGGGAEAVESAQMAQQVESVDEDVVVGLEHVARVRAVARYPAQRRHALVRQVPVRVVEVLQVMCAAVVSRAINA